jgi:hypothetical protein
LAPGPTESVSLAGPDQEPRKSEVRMLHPNFIASAMNGVNAPAMIPENIASAMESDSDPNLSLAQRRYLDLLRGLVAEYVAKRGKDHGSVSAAGRRIGLSQPYASQLLAGLKAPGLDIIQRAIDAGYHRDYFFDESLVDPNPANYLHQRVEREEDEGHPAIEAYIANQLAAGTPVSKRHQKELRGLRYALGPDALTEEVVRGTHRGLIARDANRAIDAPIVSTKIDEERGQRKLPPAKKRGA